ncbi:hypothetical protein IMCC14465_13980 [alpha proteobacterium IMCC14465]|uniref:Penicillin-binding protein 2 n=1 Tax=alpha proteobacterium IMCC14465 TaxID=1220535 RepID=J9DX74_9PROT|nr:hypothetical protein IMCC14465_13980 [alpha proteobacterium IMCC14465]
MYSPETDTQIFSRRAMILGLGQLGLFGLLAARLQYLQISQADQYGILAENNRVNIGLIAPLRGRILDRYGREIATNRPNFQVVMIPEQTNDPIETLRVLEKLVPISPSRRKRLLRDIPRSRGFVPFTVAENLEWEQFAALNLNLPHLPGVEPQVGKLRYYPQDDIFSHMVGYVGRPDGRDLRRDDPLLKVPGFRIGKSGIEKLFDDSLRGSAGSRRVEVNNVGRVIRELARNPGAQGSDLMMSMDSELQNEAIRLLGEQSGSAVVMDVNSGEVLTIASAPTFNPNHFTVGLTQKEWDGLLEDQRKPLINKALAGQYAPGSTIKMLVAMAGLEEKVITPKEKIVCEGQYELGGDTFHCWEHEGHGEMNMHDAITNSCDVYFYELARRLGIDPIEKMAKKFGLGRTSIPGAFEEKKGLIPGRDWKRANLDASWQTGETLIAGIGQGYMLVTPIQLAVMTARLANGGREVVPKLLIDAQSGSDSLSPSAKEKGDEIAINPDHIRLMQKAMTSVVNDTDGTAFGSRFNLRGVSSAGKTGTVQVRRISKDERASGIIPNEELDWHLRDHALFVGFAPIDNPKYAVAVVVEHGGSGSKVAAPIAQKLLKMALERDRVPGKTKTARAKALNKTSQKEARKA